MSREKRASCRKGNARCSSEDPVDDRRPSGSGRPNEGQGRMQTQRRQFMLRGVVFVGLATVAEASGIAPGPTGPERAPLATT
jgi:hypothetical protein